MFNRWQYVYKCRRCGKMYKMGWLPEYCKCGNHLSCYTGGVTYTVCDWNLDIVYAHRPLLKWHERVEEG